MGGGMGGDGVGAEPITNDIYWLPAKLVSIQFQPVF